MTALPASQAAVPGPAGLDIAALAEALRGSDVVFHPAAPQDPVFEADLAAAVAAASNTRAGDVDLVVLDHTPPMIADLRDAAQDLLMAGDAETVLIRTPNVAIGVSDTLTRAEIEVGERVMAAEPDYVAGVRAFVDTAEGFTVQWGVVGALLIGLCTLAFAAGFLATRRSEHL